MKGLPGPGELPWAHYTWLRQSATEYMAAGQTAQLLHWLILLGVSPDTLTRCARVVSDEVRHSTDCYRLYEHVGGPPRAVPAPPSHLHHADDPDADVVWRAVTALGQLAVEESVALPVFQLRVRNARDPEVRSVCEGILRDEAFHRAFAWDALEELTEALGPPAMNAWVAPRLGWWLRVYLLEAPTPGDVVFTEDDLAVGLIDREEHWSVMRGAVDAVILPRFRRLGLCGVAVDAAALTHELRAQGPRPVPPWRRPSA